MHYSRDLCFPFQLLTWYLYDEIRSCCMFMLCINDLRVGLSCTLSVMQGTTGDTWT